MEHRARIELFAYPWDIVDRGPEAFADECAALGVTRVHVTTLYHSGKFLLPRNSRHKVFFPEPGRLFIPLGSDAFDGPIVPEQGELAHSGWLDSLAATGLPLAAWTVFHHGSSIAARNPRFTLRNLYGDAYPFALCPSHEEVYTFSRQLASAIVSTGRFEALDLETIGYLGYFHGHHHEVSAVPCGPLEQFLLSLCFCDACSDRARALGIDIECLKSQLRDILDARFAADDSASRHPDNMEQIATLLALVPGLRELVQMRIKNVTALIHDIRAAARGVELSVFTSSFVGSPSNIWMEGVSLPDIRNTVDAVYLLAYTSDCDRVNSDLVFCLSQVGDPARLCLTLNLGLPVTPSLGDAMSKIDFAWKSGVRRFAFFNYGFLGAARLRWVREIARELQAREEK